MTSQGQPSYEDDAVTPRQGSAMSSHKGEIILDDRAIKVRMLARSFNSSIGRKTEVSREGHGIGMGGNILVGR